MFSKSLTKKNKNIVVLGGGIPGIFSALYLSKIYKSHEIFLIENSSNIGGLYNSINNEDAGIFDKGMHIIYETCDDEIDKVIRSALKDEEWIFLEGNYKDIAGVFFKGQLNTNSPYLNINQINKDKLDVCLSNLFLALQNPPPNLSECKSAQEFFEKRFGHQLTEELFEPVLSKLWGIPAKELHPAITRIILMDRLIIFDQESVKDLMKSERIRSRIAFPNQMDLDLSYRSPQRGLYPKAFGMYNVINGLEKRLKDSNIRICKNSNLKTINLSNNRINSVTFSHENKNIKIEDLEFVHSTIAPINLTKFFNLKINAKSYDKSLNQRYVYLLLKEKPNMKDLYYYYSFEEGMKTYRVTNYSSYCPDAKRKNDNKFPNSWPLCIELHYKEDKIKEDIVLKDAIKELILTGVVENEKNILYSKVYSAGGVPLLTINNCKIASNAYNQIKNLKIENLILGCQLPEKGIFFLHDVLTHTKNLIKSY